MLISRTQFSIVHQTLIVESSQKLEEEDHDGIIGVLVRRNLRIEDVRRQLMEDGQNRHSLTVNGSDHAIDGV